MYEIIIYNFKNTVILICQNSPFSELKNITKNSIKKFQYYKIFLFIIQAVRSFSFVINKGENDCVIYFIGSQIWKHTFELRNQNSVFFTT